VHPPSLPTSVFLLLAACSSAAEPEPPTAPPPAPAPAPPASTYKHQAADYVTCLQPLGPYDAELLASVARGVEALYGFTTWTLEPRPLPDAAWYPPRQRYRADDLLDHLERVVIPGSGCKFIVGFTAEDISTSKPPHVDWGVFGLGSIGGPAAVVSTDRLLPSDKGPNWNRLLGIRTVKVVNHELGHVVGLGHLPGDGCLMNDAKGTIKTVDSETGVLCDHEREAMQRLLNAELPRLELMDWDAVLAEGIEP